jgi:Copper type II ascorbate-dependent monooxygenase, C-terminal domain
MRLAAKSICAVLAVAAGTLAWPARADIGVVFRAGFDSLQLCDPVATPSTCPGFRVQTPALNVPAGQIQTFCYYFRGGNATTFGVRRWATTSGPNVLYLLVYRAVDTNGGPVERQPPGTLVVGCGPLTGTGNPSWHHAAYGPTSETVMPDDDGNGVPLGMELPADVPMVMQVRVLNPTDGPISTSASVLAEGYPSGTSFVRTASYFTVNVAFQIPAMAVQFTTTRSCTAPANSRFWAFTTRTHKLGVRSTVRRGVQDLVVSDDWAAPRITRLVAPNVVEFTPGAMYTYDCTYANPNPFTVNFGESEDSDEQCIGVGMYYPAARPVICINSTGPL